MAARRRFGRELIHNDDAKRHDGAQPESGKEAPAPSARSDCRRQGRPATEAPKFSGTCVTISEKQRHVKHGRNRDELAPEPVGKRPDDKRPDGNTQNAGGEDRAQCPTRKAPIIG